MSKIETSVEVITPKVAEQMLQNNNNNRPVNEDNLAFIMKAMKDSNFQLTGEAIKFSSGGTLLDGQHRLMAIVKSKVPCKMLVVRGLEEGVFKFLDTGRKRTAADVLHINGVSYSTNTAALINFVLLYKSGNARNFSSKNKRGGKQISNFDIAEFYEKNKESIDYSLQLAVKSKCKLMSKSQLAGWHYILKGLSFHEADEFCSKFAEGANLAKTSPIFAIREKLMQDRINKLKMPIQMKYALFIKAWNAFRKGKSVSQLRWDSQKEEFPKPI